MIEEKSMKLLPPAKHLCQVCAVEHDADTPHDAKSMYYQTKFNMEHGRRATWVDAMAHCNDDMKQIWTEELAEMGVNVGGDEV